MRRGATVFDAVFLVDLLCATEGVLPAPNGIFFSKVSGRPMVGLDPVGCLVFD